MTQLPTLLLLNIVVSFNTWHDYDGLRYGMLFFLKIEYQNIKQKKSIYDYMNPIFPVYL